MKKIVESIVVLLVFVAACVGVFGCDLALAQASNTGAPVTTTGSLSLAAMKKASEAGKTLFIFIFDKEDQATSDARKSFEAAAAKLGDTIQWVAIDRSSASESAFAEKYQLKNAPMPIVLVLAPNGAIAGSFYGEKLKDPQLERALLSPLEQQCLKALQESKVIFLCLQNSTTKLNAEAMKGVDEFKADTRYALNTEVFKVDPAGATEKEFLQKLKIDPTVTEAQTALIVPPGQIVTKVQGATTKDAFVKALEAAKAGAGCPPGAAGCGPKGCGPTPAK